MSIRFMIDTDDLSVLTDHVQLQATYSDLVTDPATLAGKFPHSIIIYIDRGLGDPGDKATIFDVERGALTVAQAVNEYDRKHAQGIRELTVYCDRSTLPAVNAAFGARQVYRWVATLDGTAHIDGHKPLESPAAVQCLSAAMLGIHADGSLVFQDGWHRQAEVADPKVVKADLTAIGGELSKTAADLHELAAAIGV